MHGLEFRVKAQQPQVQNRVVLVKPVPIDGICRWSNGSQGRHGQQQAANTYSHGKASSAR
jgi:hypothetical protein